ncbi:MAG: hypothetical protein PHX61_13130 [Alphaproteobacteria bacterium]|nr:hypothetical protein [Alphaproteobacteria bacterium]
MILTYVISRSTGLSENEIYSRMKNEMKDQFFYVSIAGVATNVGGCVEEIKGVGDDKILALMNLSSNILRAKDRGNLRIAPDVCTVGAIPH